MFEEAEEIAKDIYIHHKEKYHGKLYTFNGFGVSNCPVCKREDFDVIHDVNEKILM